MCEGQANPLQPWCPLIRNEQIMHDYFQTAHGVRWASLHPNYWTDRLSGTKLGSVVSLDRVERAEQKIFGSVRCQFTNGMK